MDSVCAITKVSQPQGLNITFQSQGTLRVTLLLSLKMICSNFQEAAPVAGRLPNAAQALSLQSQLSGRPRSRAGGPLSSHPPQLPDLPFAPRHYSAATEERVELSSTILTQADIEWTDVPEPPANNKRSHQPTPVRNFSLPTFHPKQPRKMARYYASALTHDEKTALAEGQKNHNLKSWTAKHLILHEEALKDIKPTNLYIGPDEEVCIIPVIIVTDGQKARTHKQQLCHKLHKLRVSSAPAVQQAVSGPIAQERAQVFAASRSTSDGGYFATTHRPVSYRPPHPASSGVRVRSPLANEVSHYEPRKDVTFDGILVPHRSGKGEAYLEQENVRSKKAKRKMGISRTVQSMR